MQPERSVIRRDAEPSSLRAYGYGLALLIFVLDQIVKYIIIEEVELQGRGFIDVLPFFNLTWVENRGVSMGMLTASSDKIPKLMARFFLRVFEINWSSEPSVC